MKSQNMDVMGVLEGLRYADELVALQVELVKLQRWFLKTHRRLAILFEGRNATGKGSAIRCFTAHLNPRSLRVVALPKPTDEERGQWYFQRYARQLPNPGEIVFFDRSWFSRAVVEPVQGTCSQKDYERFLQQVPEFEHMLYEDGIFMVKFWFSLSKDEQQRRFDSRRDDIRKQWKPGAEKSNSQKLWDKHTYYKEQMFSKTHTSFSPWIIVRADDKRKARLESIRHVLNQFPYEGKEDATVRIDPDPNIIVRFHRESAKID